MLKSVRKRNKIMKSNSITVTLARVARDIERWHNGVIKKDRLIALLHEYSVNQDDEAYIVKMVAWGYLYFDPITNAYHLTDAAKQTATQTVTAPRLNANETRRHLVETLVRYNEIITVGEVEL